MFGISIYYTKITLLGFVAVYAAARLVLARSTWRHNTKAMTAIAGALFALSFAAHTSTFHRYYGTFLNMHDVYHYYFGSKYAAELGYFDIYNCSMLALTETAKADYINTMKQPVRRLVDHRYIPKEKALQDARDGCRLKFTDGRWDEFKSELLEFTKFKPAKQWQEMMRDKGYNATPFWNLVGGFFTRFAHASSIRSLEFLGWLDHILLLAIVPVLIWSFGVEIGLLASSLYCAGFAIAPGHIRGGFLRHDWLAAMAIGIGLLRKGWYATAAGAFVYAALARVFPAAFFFGPAARAVWAFAGTRKIDPMYKRFFASAAICLIVFTGATVVDGGGIRPWRQFFQNILVHDGEISNMRIGLKYAILFDGEMSRKDYVPGKKHRTWEEKWAAFDKRKQKQWRDRSWIRYSLTCAGFLLVLLAALRARNTYESYALGILLMYFIITPTFYYYVVMLVPAVLYASRPRSAVHAAGLAGLAVVNILWFWLDRKYIFLWTKSGYQSLVLGIYTGLMLILHAGENLGASRHILVYWQNLKTLLRGGQFEPFPPCPEAAATTPVGPTTALEPASTPPAPDRRETPSSPLSGPG